MEYRDNATPTDVVSGEFGTEVITLDSDGLGQGSDQGCRSITILVEEAKDVTFGESVLAAASGVPLPNGVSTHPLELPVSNTNKLYFKGTAADKVFLIWRS